MSIANKLNQIKNAIYGKDVRGAIHDAIKQVYDDASVNHDNANMEVKMARGTHNTLNNRLDNVDEIQAQTNAQLSRKINHGESGVITNTMLSQEVKESMTGGSVAVVGANSVLDENIARNNINVEHTNFLSGSKNKFDYSFMKEGFDLNDGDNGNLRDNTSMIACEKFIPVSPNTSYCVTKLKKNILFFFYDYSKNYVSLINLNTTNTQVFTVPTNCYYVRFYTFLTIKDSLKNFQLEEGTSLSAYNVYKEFIIPKNNIEEGEVLTDLAQLLTIGKNILNTELFVKGKEINGNGQVVDNANLMSTIEYIPIEPDTDYAITSVAGAMIFTFYNINKEIVKYINIDTNSVITTQSPSDAYYVRLTTFTNKESYLSTMQLEKGTVNTTYEPYGKYVNKIYLQDSKDNDTFNSLIWNSLGDSITKMNDYIEGYQTKVSKKLGIPTIRNYGIGGTMLCLKDDDSNSSTAMCNRYIDMNDNADIITVMGGANDWSGSRKLDNDTDRYDKHTIGGAMRVIIEGLMTKYPKKHIIWITCPPRLCTAFQNQLNSYGEQIDANGNTIEAYANKQIEVCREYNIPCIDVHHNVGFNRFNIGLFTASNDRGEEGEPDNVHMNDLGHERIASIITEEFKKYL